MDEDDLLDDNKEDGKNDDKNGQEEPEDQAAKKGTGDMGGRKSGGSQKQQHKTVMRNLNLSFDEAVSVRGAREKACVWLLQAMELGGEEMDNGVNSLLIDPDSEQIQEEDQINLPEAWVESIKEDRKGADIEWSSKDQGDSWLNAAKKGLMRQEELDSTQKKDTEETLSTQPSLDDMEKHRNVEGKRKKDKVWGPIVVERKSKRNVNDGKTVLEKAQELKMRTNLEVEAEKVWGLAGYGDSTAMDLKDCSKLDTSLSGNKKTGTVLSPGDFEGEDKEGSDQTVKVSRLADLKI